MRFILAIFLMFASALHSYEKTLGVCAMFKNEARFLKEWIDYHLLVGAEEFWLYNNNSDDDYLSVLQPYIDEGIVHLIPWPSKEFDEDYQLHWAYEVQTRAYNNCLNQGKGRVKWLAFIDIDEFIVPMIGDSIPFVLENYFPKVSGLCINWFHFGTSFVKELKPGDLLIEKLTKCAPLSYHRNRLFKSIVQVRYAKNCTNPHFFHYSRGCHVNTNIEKVSDLNVTGPFYDKLRINHYWTKDEVYMRGEKASRLTKWNNCSYQEAIQSLENENNTLCLDEDREILRFVERLKKESP